MPFLAPQRWQVSRRTAPSDDDTGRDESGDDSVEDDDGDEEAPPCKSRHPVKISSKCNTTCGSRATTSRPSMCGNEVSRMRFASISRAACTFTASSTRVLGFLMSPGTSMPQQALNSMRTSWCERADSLPIRGWGSWHCTMILLTSSRHALSTFESLMVSRERSATTGVPRWRDAVTHG